MFAGISGLDGSTLIPGIIVTDIDGSFKKLLLQNWKYADWY